MLIISDGFGCNVEIRAKHCGDRFRFNTSHLHFGHHTCRLVHQEISYRLACDSRQIELSCLFTFANRISTPHLRYQDNSN